MLCAMNKRHQLDPSSSLLSEEAFEAAKKKIVEWCGSLEIILFDFKYFDSSSEYFFHGFCLSSYIGTLSATRFEESHMGNFFCYEMHSVEKFSLYCSSLFVFFLVAPLQRGCWVEAVPSAAGLLFCWFYAQFIEIWSAIKASFGFKCVFVRIVLKSPFCQLISCASHCRSSSAPITP